MIYKGAIEYKESEALRDWYDFCFSKTECDRSVLVRKDTLILKYKGSKALGDWCRVTFLKRVHEGAY